jgi:hypothetical protein
MSIRLSSEVSTELVVQRIRRQLLNPNAKLIGGASVMFADIV